MGAGNGEKVGVGRGGGRSGLGIGGCGSAAKRSCFRSMPHLRRKKRAEDGARRIQGPSATAHPQVRPEDDRKTAMEKMENKGRFPLSHGTAAAICMNIRSCLKTEGFGHGFARIVGLRTGKDQKDEIQGSLRQAQGRLFTAFRMTAKNKQQQRKPKNVSFLDRF